MNDREMMQKALSPLTASEDTLDRVYEKIGRKRKRTVGGRLSAVLAVAVILVLGSSVGIHAAAQFTGEDIAGQVMERLFRLGGRILNPSKPDADERVSASDPSAAYEKEADGINEFAISLPFGYQSAVEAGSCQHDGVDFAAERGTPVLAAADGKVLETGYDTHYGNYVRLEHQDGFVTTYGCLQDLCVAVGDDVLCEQQVGTVGATGMATGPHLHLELRLYGEAVNPMDYFE